MVKATLKHPKKYYLVQDMGRAGKKIIDKSSSRTFIKHKQQWWAKFGKHYEIVVLTN